jgi:hypothetical protein
VAFELANRLIGIAPGGIEHVFYTNSGSESVETALKLAIAYHRARGEGAPGGSQAMRAPAPVLAEREVDRLIGLSREAVLAMLGPSTFTRRDGPAEILRYATDDCFLTLFLHRGDQPRGGTLTVHHVDANARSRAAAGWVNARTCYGQVLELRGIPVREG